MASGWHVRTYSVCFFQGRVHSFYHILQGPHRPQKAAVIAQKIKARAPCLMLALLSHPKEEGTRLMRQFPTRLQVGITW